MTQRRLLALGGALLAAGVAAYLLVARLVTGAGGLPLDDAWIHQTLARNLAQVGQMVMTPGEPSAASTSPLWSVLLAGAYWLGLPPLMWALALGVGCLAATAGLTYRLGRVLGLPPAVGAAAALLVLVEWRLLWAALSGMETLLFSALTLAALTGVLSSRGQAGWRAGLACGLAAAARPEGLALAALLGAWLAWRRVGVRALAGFAVGVALPLLPGAALNLAQHGSPLPATFFAKNAAYAGGIDPARYLAFTRDVLLVLVRGPEWLLLPGLAWFVVRSARGVAGAGLLLLWLAGLTLAYALWLPALYHHGRYLFPLLPLVLLLGLAGSRELLAGRALRLLPAVGVAAMVLYTGYGWLRGAQEYAANVDLINRQQVWAALWVRAEAPPGQVVAAHDIGALAYFGGHPVLDMAGLATPGLPQGPRDTAAVVRLATQRGAHFALAIPDWYPPLYQALLGQWRPVLAAPAPAGVPQGQVLQILHWE